MLTDAMAEKKFDTFDNVKILTSYQFFDCHTVNSGTRDTWRHTKRYKRRDFNQQAGCQETQGTRRATS